jgi:hypothetical protein
VNWFRHCKGGADGDSSGKKDDGTKDDGGGHTRTKDGGK